MMEEWIARRIDSPHVLKPRRMRASATILYVVTEFIDGQTLAQWMLDNPRPDLETVRGIVEQIAKGLHAFHRLEMLHQDLRPDNIMIDRTGTVKIIDFGSTRVAGVAEATPAAGQAANAGHGAIHRAGIFPGRGRHRRAPTSFRSASSPIRCSPGGCPTARGAAKARTQVAATQAAIPLGARRQPRHPGLDRRRAEKGGASRSRAPL